MFVDDHDEMCNGLENTITVRVSFKELAKLAKGELVRGRNKSGNKIQVIIMAEDNPRPISSS